MNAPVNIEAATLCSAMAAAFGEIEGATKSANNPHFKTKYADLTAVIEAIKPALINHGLFFTQHPKPSEKGITVETVLHHCNGDHLSLGELFVPANKQDAQGFGSALTYARRYALVTAFGVPVEDDDGNAAASSSQASGRDNTGDRQSSPPGTTQAQPSDRITEEQLTKIQMLIKAAKLDEITFIKGMGAPEGARIFQLPQSLFAEAVERLETRLKKMAEAETNNAAKGASGEFADVTEADCPF